MKKGFVYILTNKQNTVFYTGVSSNIIKRIWQHKQKQVKGFSRKYNLTKLVYFEIYDSIEEAIKREKYIKGKKREYKLTLIRKDNPKFKDLYPTIT